MAELEENDDPDHRLSVLVSRKYITGRTISVYHYVQQGIRDLSCSGFRTGLVSEPRVWLQYVLLSYASAIFEANRI